MKKLLAVTVGLTALVAFAFQSPNNSSQEPTNLLENDHLVITLEGIKDGQTTMVSEDFISEID